MFSSTLNRNIFAGALAWVLLASSSLALNIKGVDEREALEVLEAKKYCEQVLGKDFQEIYPYQLMDPTVHLNEVKTSFSKLGIHEKPSLGKGTIDVDGLLKHLRGVPVEEKFKTYGPEKGQIDYINKTPGRYEGFAQTGTAKKISRKTQPLYGSINIFNGTRIFLDGGHLIDHVFTKISSIWASLSTGDFDNFTPQNNYYNRNIRNHLVSHQIKKFNDTYKEIPIYSEKSYKTRDQKGKEVEVPEGYVFIHYKNHKPFAAYYFPNLIDYDKAWNLTAERGNPRYMQFCKEYQNNELIQYFKNPSLKSSKLEKASAKRKKCKEISKKAKSKDLLKDFFKGFQENQMPQRAQEALLEEIEKRNRDYSKTYKPLVRKESK